MWLEQREQSGELQMRMGWWCKEIMGEEEQIISGLVNHSMNSGFYEVRREATGGLGAEWWPDLMHI